MNIQHKYTDLDLSFILHRVLKDIRPVYDLAAIKNAVKNLLVYRLFRMKKLHPLLLAPRNKFTIASDVMLVEMLIGF